jgi:hypothetical protein
VYVSIGLPLEGDAEAEPDVPRGSAPGAGAPHGVTDAVPSLPKASRHAPRQKPEATSSINAVFPAPRPLSDAGGVESVKRFSRGGGGNPHDLEAIRSGELFHEPSGPRQIFAVRLRESLKKDSSREPVPLLVLPELSKTGSVVRLYVCEARPFAPRRWVYRTLSESKYTGSFIFIF